MSYFTGCEKAITYSTSLAFYIFSSTRLNPLKINENSCLIFYNWAATRDFQQCGMYDQQSLRSACAYAQSDQSLCKSLDCSMTAKLLNAHYLEILSVKGGCIGWSGSTLVKITHCWKSHVAAQMRTPVWSSIYASEWDFQQCGMCDQQSLRSACAYTQSDQSLCKSLKYSITAKLLTEQHLEFLSFKGCCTGSSESTLVKIPHCWKPRIVAHILFPGGQAHTRTDSRWILLT